MTFNNLVIILLFFFCPDFAQWQQQMATQSGADESFMAATQGINQSGSQGRYIIANAATTKLNIYIYIYKTFNCEPVKWLITILATTLNNSISFTE